VYICFHFESSSFNVHPKGPHSFPESDADPDTHWPKKLDTDAHNVDANLKH
jgi:hypothetical protein